ncbi:MAG: ABC transporter substrate-binding protein, partial [Allobaculum sp.]|nr:ABC transporter substrate-binding protein [Allobaculum sp.]
YIVFEEGKGFEVDTSVSIGLKNNTRDTEEFQNIQKALDEISQDQRDEMMVSAVNNAPTGD